MSRVTQLVNPALHLTSIDNHDAAAPDISPFLPPSGGQLHI
jgi:hypothetical protein